MTELRRRALFAAFAALAFSLAYLRASERAGRLSQDLAYDDVSYVLDAAERLDVGYEGGPLRFLATFWKNPPHSPFQTVLAVAGMGAFGFQDSAAYAMNAIILVLTSLLIVHVFRDERRWVAGLFVAVYLTSALAYGSVTEFRPDLASGMATACFAVFFTQGALLGRASALRAAGWVLGLALLIKPSFVGHTLVVAAWLCLLWALHRWRTRDRPVASAGAVARALATGAALAAPYYVAHGREVLRYFWTNTGGADRSLWLVDPALSFGKTLYRFALDRGFGLKMVGFTLHASLALCAVGLVVLAVGRRRDELRLLGALLSTGCVSLLVVTLGRMDNEFFGATFHALVILGGYFSFAALTRLVPGRAAWIGVAYAAASVAAVVGNAALPRWWVPPDVVRPASWNDAIISAIRDDARVRGIALQRAWPVPVFVTAAGPINSTVLQWTARKARLPVAVSDLSRTDSLEALTGAAREAAYVVVPNPERAEILRFLPAARLQGAFLAHARADPTLRSIPAGYPGDPDRYLVFANTRVLDRAAEANRPVFPAQVESVTGFRGEEGPYPQWNLGRVRWLVSPRARICLGALAPGAPAEVTASVRPAVRGTLRVALEDEELIAVPLAPAAEFIPVRFTVNAAASPTCLDLTVDGAPPSATQILLFARFDVARSTSPR